jgi:hypothetical protein
MFLKPFVADWWILVSSPSPDGAAVVARAREQGVSGVWPPPQRRGRLVRLARAGGWRRAWARGPREEGSTELGRRWGC